MGWVILIIAVALLLTGLMRGFSGEQTGNRTDPDRHAENDDEQMLEDWYTSQELDNDLDEWDK